VLVAQLVAIVATSWLWSRLYETGTMTSQLLMVVAINLGAFPLVLAFLLWLDHSTP
jgi:hypothetical protein